MKYDCAVIDDLLPLYLDGACSDESRALVEQHLEECRHCREKYQRMTDELSLPEVPTEGGAAMAGYAKKVKRHRLRLAACSAAIAAAAVLLVVLLVLTFMDMRMQENPTVYPVEDGVYNLTSNELTVKAAEADGHVLYTNNMRIRVRLAESIDRPVEVQLWNADDRDAPYAIQYGSVSEAEDCCTFGGLSSAHRYMVSCDDADALLIISDGRDVSFFGSMKNVLWELFSTILQ